MADIRRTSEYRKFLPFIARASGDVGNDTVGEDVMALLQALNDHKTGTDHDGRYYTEGEVDSALLLKADKTITLTAGNGLNGGGDLSANRTFDVVTGRGLTFDLDVSLGSVVAVDLDANFDWSGTHSFGATISSQAIVPQTADTYDLGSYSSAWRKIFASELSAVIFAQYGQVLLGGWFTVSKGEGVLGADVTTLSTTMDLGRDDLTGGDFLVFRGVSVLGTPQVEYVQVGTRVAGNIYNVVRDMDGSGPNDWVAGTVYANYGSFGAGRIELNAYDTPRLSVFSHSNEISAFREQVRIGDLLNGWGYSTTTYGGAFGAYESGKANITIDPTNGVRIRNYDQTVIQLTGTEASFENVIKLGTSGRLQQGTGTWGTDFTGSAIWNDSGVMSIGGWNNNVKQWWGGSDGKFYAGGGEVQIDKDGISFIDDGSAFTSPGVIKFYTPNKGRLTGYLKSFGDSCSTWLGLSSIDEDGVPSSAITSVGAISELFAQGGLYATARSFGEDAFVNVISSNLPGNVYTKIMLKAESIEVNGGVNIGGTSAPGDNNLVVGGNATIGGHLFIGGTIKKDANKVWPPKYYTRKVISDNAYSEIFRLTYASSGAYTILLTVTVSPSIISCAYAAISKTYLYTSRFYTENNVNYHSGVSTVLGVNDTGSRSSTYADVDAPLISVDYSTSPYTFSATYSVKCDALGSSNPQGVNVDVDILPIGGRNGGYPEVTWL